MTISRLSTLGQYQQSLNSLLSQQQSLGRTFQQISSGSRLATGMDDPMAAGQAVQLNRAIDQSSQRSFNASSLDGRLTRQESALSEAGDLVSRARSLIIQAGSPSTSTSDKQNISKEVDSIRDQLVSIANTDDGAGRYLFGGAQDRNAPFSVNGSSVEYNGDQTQRQISISSDLNVSDTFPGSEVFLRIPNGDGTLNVTANKNNTGSGTIADFAVNDMSALSQSSFNIVFKDSGHYDITDSNNKVLQSGAIDNNSDSEKTTIRFSGTQITLQGTPAQGDSFQSALAKNQDIFSILSNFSQNLKASTTTEGQSSLQQNSFQDSLRSISNAEQHLLNLRVQGGSAQNAIDSAKDSNDQKNLLAKKDLSSIQDVDYAKALTSYNQQRTALDAAQRVFSQMQQMSLFKYLS